MSADPYIFYHATERGQAPQIAKTFEGIKYIFNKRRSTQVSASFAAHLLDEKTVEKGFSAGSAATAGQDDAKHEPAAKAAGEALFRKENPKRAKAEDDAVKRDNAKKAKKRDAEKAAVAENAKAVKAKKEAEGVTNG